MIASQRYDAWKANFVEKGGLAGALTVPADNEILVWEYRPNATGESWGTQIRTNNYGFRDRDWSQAATSDVQRIAFAGDSVTLGLGVAADATFVRLFESQAAAKSPPSRVEAMSFAVGGYSGSQVVEMVREKIIPFSPNTIIYVMCMNDFDFVHSSGQVMKYFRKPGNFLIRFLERTYAKFFVDNYYEYHYRKNKDTVMAELDVLNRELEELDVDFRVLLMPVFKGDQTWTDYPLTDMHTDLLASLKDKGITTIDFLGRFDDRELPRSAYAFDDVHLTEVGHQLVAGELGKELLASGQTIH